MSSRQDFGLVKALTIRLDGAFYLLNATLEEQEEAITLTNSREALRSLWAHLTHILYSRASDQLTERISTIKSEKDDVPEDVTYKIVAYADKDNTALIVVSGFARSLLWTLRLTQDTGYDLWAMLEDQLNQV